MKYWQLAVINAVIISLITLFTNLITVYPPNQSAIYQALLTFAITLLVQLRGIVDEYKKKLKPEKKQSVDNKHHVLMLI
jgi:hypothetical protein